jgi:hypothetical protein
VPHYILVEKPEEKRPLGIRRRRLKDNIKIDFEEIGNRCMDGIHLLQDIVHWRDLLNTIL